MLSSLGDEDTSAEENKLSGGHDLANTRYGIDEVS